jgi:cold shock CspA family protein
VKSEFITGKVSNKNEELEYGFVSVAKIGDIFFSSETKFYNTDFPSISIGQKVIIQIEDSPRGPFASYLIFMKNNFLKRMVLYLVPPVPNIFMH